MAYKRLFILVEGLDDLRLFEEVLKPKFGKAYDWVEVRPYRHWKRGKINSLLRSIKSFADYIFAGDINDAPCVTAKKQTIQSDFSAVDQHRVLVVVKEVESWYLAGLDDQFARSLKLSPLDSTDRVTKEEFDRLIPKKYDSRVDWMSEILKHFSIDTAAAKNRSFRYSLEKYNCEV